MIAINHNQEDHEEGAIEMPHSARALIAHQDHQDQDEEHQDSIIVHENSSSIRSIDQP